MAESLRSVQFQVEIDTNKATYKQSFELIEGETIQELLARVQEWVEVMTGSIG